jgi:hypothetical protein
VVVVGERSSLLGEYVVKELVAFGDDALVLQKDSIDLLVEKILLFIETLSGVPLFPYQREFARRIVESLVINDGAEITGLFARQSGKSETVAQVAAGCMVILPKLYYELKLPMLEKFKDGLWVGLFAPRSEQARTTFQRTKERISNKHASMILNDPEIAESVRATGGIIALNNGSFMLPMSAAPQAEIESKTYHLMYLEEAQLIDATKSRKSIRPMGAFTNATIVQTGTCHMIRGEFYRACMRNKREALKRGSVQNHFEYDYKQVIKYNPNYKKYIDKEKKRLGENSDDFRLSYKLEWLFDRGMFITEGILEDVAADKKRKWVDGLREGVQIAGLDLGKHHDSTVLTILDIDEELVDEDGNMPRYILDIDELSGDDYEAQYPQIVDKLRKYNTQVVLVDATGVGDPIVERLQRLVPDDILVVGQKLTLQSKSDMYYYLQQELKAGRVVVPWHAKTVKTITHRKFVQQMIELEKTYMGRYMKVAHPDERDAHDDYPDSLALAVWATKTQIMPDMLVDDSDIFD